MLSNTSQTTNKQVGDHVILCDKLLDESEIRFAGIINKMGRLVAGGFKEGIIPLADDEEQRMCMEYTLEIVMTKDLDNALGSIEYIISKREKVTMITIPIQIGVLLICIEPDHHAEKTVKKINLELIANQIT